MLSSGKDYDADAIIAPSQGTPQHSKFLTTNSFQSILSTPWKFLTKARMRVSLNNRMVVLKTNIFSVKQPSTWNNKNSATHSSARNKEKKSLQRSLKKVGSLLSDKGMKCKMCGLLYYEKRMSMKSALD
jgi:hypothetical protein